jgi:HlyD family secretion protein
VKTAARTRVRWMLTVVGMVIAALFLAYAAGFFPHRAKLPPGQVALVESEPEPARKIVAAQVDVPAWYETVGTVESRTTANVAARISAPVIAIAVDAGAAVAEGAELVYLDDRELRARKSQAEGALAAAEAGLRESERAREAVEAQAAQADASYRRTKGFREQGVASPAEFEAAEAAFRQAEAWLARAKAAIERATAEVERSRQAVREADVALGYTRVLSPVTGEVARRLVDPGDLAWPGRTLIVIHDRQNVRLRASVREGLWGDVGVGRDVEVSVPAIAKTFTAKIDEVEPTADPRSRSIVVKVPLPREPGLYPGMFGRLRIQLGKRPAIMLPAEAIIRVGQLAAVRVHSGDRWLLRNVQLGAAAGDKVEVLAGLQGGEEVGL